MLASDRSSTDLIRTTAHMLSRDTISVPKPPQKASNHPSHLLETKHEVLLVTCRETPLALRSPCQSLQPLGVREDLYCTPGPRSRCAREVFTRDFFL
jgi:hypothetical protein